MRIFLVIALLFPSLACAEIFFDANGYNLSIKISYIGRNHLIEGRVNGGKSCKNLVIAAKGEDDDGHVAYFKTDRFEYTEGFSILYESGTTNTTHINSDWNITSVVVSCEDTSQP